MQEEPTGDDLKLVSDKDGTFHMVPSQAVQGSRLLHSLEFAKDEPRELHLSMHGHTISKIVDFLEQDDDTRKEGDGKSSSLIAKPIRSPCFEHVAPQPAWQTPLFAKENARSLKDLLQASTYLGIPRLENLVLGRLATS